MLGASTIEHPRATPPEPAPAPDRSRRDTGRPEARFSITSLLTGRTSIAKGRSLTLSVSVVLHALLVAALVVVPLFAREELPTPARSVRAFFTAPPELAPPPPPPPPPPPGARLAKTPSAKPAEPAKLVAPTEIPDEIPTEEGLGLALEGGMPGGVEGGVPGGVLGGIVGGLPPSTPPPPPEIVRVGGQIVAPELVHRVQPEYPTLALHAGVSGVVIMEARVDTRGRVEMVEVLRGHPLLNDAAVEAVKQWRYRPLLLNGMPTQFILTVTINFELGSRS